MCVRREEGGKVNASLGVKRGLKKATASLASRVSKTHRQLPSENMWTTKPRIGDAITCMVQRLHIRMFSFYIPEKSSRVVST